MLFDLSAGAFAVFSHYVPVPVLGAGLAAGGSITQAIQPDGVLLPLALVLLLVAATLPIERLAMAARPRGSRG